MLLQNAVFKTLPTPLWLLPFFPDHLRQWPFSFRPSNYKRNKVRGGKRLLHQAGVSSAGKAKGEQTREKKTFCTGNLTETFFLMWFLGNCTLYLNNVQCDAALQFPPFLFSFVGRHCRKLFFPILLYFAAAKLFFLRGNRCPRQWEGSNSIKSLFCFSHHIFLPSASFILFSFFFLLAASLCLMAVQGREKRRQ